MDAERSKKAEQKPAVCSYCGFCTDLRYRYGDEHCQPDYIHYHRFQPNGSAVVRGSGVFLYSDCQGPVRKQRRRRLKPAGAGLRGFDRLHRHTGVRQCNDRLCFRRKNFSGAGGALLRSIRRRRRRQRFRYRYRHHFQFVIRFVKLYRRRLRLRRPDRRAVFTIGKNCRSGRVYPL